MLQNAYLDAEIGVDTAENEPRKECCVVATEPILSTSRREDLGRRSVIASIRSKKYNRSSGTDEGDEDEAGSEAVYSEYEVHTPYKTVQM